MIINAAAVDTKAIREQVEANLWPYAQLLNAGLIALLNEIDMLRAVNAELAKTLDERTRVFKVVCEMLDELESEQVSRVRVQGGIEP